MDDNSYAEAFELEIARTAKLARRLLSAYEDWGSQVKWGEVGLVTHGDIIDFVNFRMESAESCLSLVESGRVGDALGLSRSLLENYLLFILMCRGDRYFRVLDLSHKTSAEFASIFDECRKTWEIDRAAGETRCIDVRKHPRATRHIMFVYDGIAFNDGEKLPVSMYYFHFEQFRPDTMRLDAGDYFEYYERPADLKKAMKGHRQEAQLSYRHFLSYDALLMCLELNGLMDEVVRRRLQAHYTFLGTYLHPTHNAMRNLRVRSNWHTHRTMIGMEYPYTQAARLLGSVYVCHLVAGILQELASLFEAASHEYIKDAGTSELRDAVNEVTRTVDYFWFLYNDAPLYDKFNWAVHHASDDQLADWGGFENAPSNLIPFNQHIYSGLESGLQGWSNSRVGAYESPLWRRLGGWGPCSASPIVTTSRLIVSCVAFG